MANTTNVGLTAASALDGLEQDIGGVRVTEVTGLAIASIALPLGGEEKLKQALASQFQLGLPAPGSSQASPPSNARLMGLARDQWFLLLDDAGPSTVAGVAQRLQAVAYITDQSDSWVMIRISGPTCRAALERVCPLDLHPEAFAVGATGRTVMEHLGVILLCEDSDTFLLLSARSSAQSFWHMIKTSIASIL